MDENNPTEPAVREVATSSNITINVTQIVDSTSSSESEDDELEHTAHIMEREETLPRLERHMEDIVAASNDQQFKLNFRMSRRTFDYILGIISPKLKNMHPGAIPPEKQILMTLLFVTSSDTNRSVGEKFNVCRESVVKSTNKVLKALYDLAPKIIKWPWRSNIKKIWKGFENISDFPKVIGVLGCTDIKIPPQNVYSEVSFKNPKGTYSLQLQMLCDHKTRFIHCFAECPGYVPCDGVFQLSELRKWLGNPFRFPANCHILGDAAYKLHENVIVPYHDNGHLTLKQQNFNLCHSAAKITVKKACGLLNTRFCNMKYALKIKKFGAISIFVIACCVIHNICVSKKDEIDYDFIDEAAENIPFHPDIGSREARDKRDSICEMLPMCHI